MLVKLFFTVVCPTLEHYNLVWGPLFILDQRKIEKIQRRATRLLSPIRDRPYGKRLSILQLPSLAYRHLRSDMILLATYIKSLIIILAQTFLHYVPIQLLSPPGDTNLNYSSIAQD